MNINSLQFAAVYFETMPYENVHSHCHLTVFASQVWYAKFYLCLHLYEGKTSNDPSPGIT